MSSRVDVIMAAYNVEPYVGDAVLSVLGQSLGDLRLIVVDDGSTDGTSRILESFRDPRLVIIRTANGGVCRARNRALDEVKAEYVAIMDSDDLSAPDRLARQVAYLDAHDGLVGVGSGVWLLTPAGRKVYEDRAISGADIVMAELYQVGGALYPATCTMRTAVVRSVGGYRPAIPVSEDLDLLLRMSMYGNFDNIQDALYCYRLNGGSLTFSSKARRDHYARIALDLLSERRVTGTDRLDRGESVEPYIPSSQCTNDGSYQLKKVLGYFHRQSAIQMLDQGERARAIGPLIRSLACAPRERNTWRAISRLVRPAKPEAGS